MKLKLIILSLLAPFLIAADTPAPFDRMQGNTGSEQILAFVGEQIYTNKVSDQPNQIMHDSSMNEDIIFISMDTEWQSRFRVLEVLRGDYDDKTIDFTAFDHYGQPRYSNADGPVLIYLHDYESGWIHDKYNFADVHPTDGGGWAVCDTVFNEYDSERISNPAPRPVIFDPPVVIDLNDSYRDVETEVAEYNDEEIELKDSDLEELKQEISEHNNQVDRTFTAPIYTRVENEARCEYGLPLDVVIAHEFETKFRPRLVQQHCEDQNPGSNDWSDRARRDGAALRVEACEATLLASNWPYSD